MEIKYFESLDSTHTYLVKQVSQKKIDKPIAIVAKKQTCGVGSRGNSWESCEGNLYISFVLDTKDLPSDLPLSSCSIYFAYMLVETLRKYKSKVWLKWPNDIYLGDLKVGGMISVIKGEKFICSFGLNTKNAPFGFEKIDINIENSQLITSYFDSLKKVVSWKLVFSKFKIEFELSKKFFANINDKKRSLKSAILCDDGSLLLDDERIYALR